MSRRWLTGFFFLGAAWLGASCGGDENNATCQGAEGCACYGNSTCDPGLECQSNHCVEVSSGGSAGGNAGGGGNSGGSNNTGGSGNAGGSSNTGGNGNAGGSGNSGGSGNAGGSNNTGGNASGGTNAGGSSTGGSTQSGGTGGSGGAGGAGEPAFGPCFIEDDGFETCSEACTSIGETCAEAACNGDTWRGWGSAAEAQCMQLAGAERLVDSMCDEPLEWAGNSRIIRCCCSDTQ